MIAHKVPWKGHSGPCSPYLNKSEFGFFVVFRKEGRLDFYGEKSPGATSARQPTKIQDKKTTHSSACLAAFVWSQMWVIYIYIYILYTPSHQATWKCKKAVSKRKIVFQQGFVHQTMLAGRVSGKSANFPWNQPLGRQGQALWKWRWAAGYTPPGAPEARGAEAS